MLHRHFIHTFMNKDNDSHEWLNVRVSIHESVANPDSNILTSYMCYCKAELIKFWQFILIHVLNKVYNTHEYPRGKCIVGMWDVGHSS